MARLRLIRLLWEIRATSAVLIVATALACVFATFVRADAVVTLCHSDFESGNGLNLIDALLAQPSTRINGTLVNKITFQCPGPATIQIGTPLLISQATAIEGGGVVTLLGTTLDPIMISVQDPGNFLFLSNLTLRNPVEATPTPCSLSMWAQSGCQGRVITGQGTIELHHVHIDGTRVPIGVTGGTVAVFDSEFTGNSEAVIVAAPNVTSVTISSSSNFHDNPGAPLLIARGNISITDSQFINNFGSVFTGDCNLTTVERSTFKLNQAKNFFLDGGALTIGCSTAAISHSQFENNSAGSRGGAIWFSPFAGGRPSSALISLRANKFLNNTSQDGGAVRWDSSGGEMDILFSTFTGNTAQVGGAVDVESHSASSVKARVVTFSRNAAIAVSTIVDSAAPPGSGGAISAAADSAAATAELDIARGVFADNTASGHGGGVFLTNSAQAHSHFANTLFIRNSATSGSAFFGDNTDFIYSTVDSNTGVAISNSAPPHSIKFGNSIISNNQPRGCDAAGSFELFKFNIVKLQSPAPDCGASSSADPQLDSMYIPLPKSPAIGAGDPELCQSPDVALRDVYGLARSPGCTIGAAEGDIQVLLNRRNGQGQHGACGGCRLILLQQLKRLFPDLR
jgi:hypothetical protein